MSFSVGGVGYLLETTVSTGSGCLAGSDDDRGTCCGSRCPDLQVREIIHMAKVVFS